jgi:KDO2-lipid IV(A) lauroyltransferase
MYKVDKRHRQVGIDNLARAFGDQYSPAQRDEIVRGIYRHFCVMLMEILHTPRRLRLENWRASVVLVNLAPLMDHLMSGDRPLIVLSGHYGNWELAGFLFGMFGFSTVSVARTLDNPYLDRYLRDFRERTGQSLVPKTGGFDQMVEVLENNRKGGHSALFRGNKGGHSILFTRKSAIPPFPMSAFCFTWLACSRRL